MIDATGSEIMELLYRDYIGRSVSDYIGSWMLKNSIAASYGRSIPFDV